MCLGCGRTLDEIARWIAMSEAERGRIMAELPGGSPPCNAVQARVGVTP